MKVFVKTDESWKIVESVIANVQDFELIEVSDEELEKLNAQFDTVVKGWKITAQTKWQNAELFEKRKLEAEETARKEEEALAKLKEEAWIVEVSESETEIQK